MATVLKTENIHVYIGGQKGLNTLSVCRRKSLNTHSLGAKIRKSGKLGIFIFYNISVQETSNVR